MSICGAFFQFSMFVVKMLLSRTLLVWKMCRAGIWHDAA